MNGYIVVADDLLFDNQRVAVGETITLSLNQKMSRNDRDLIYRTFATAVDRAAHDIAWYSANEVPTYRIFEVDVHGPCIREGVLLWCTSITIVRECTPETDSVPASRQTYFDWWSMMYNNRLDNVGYALLYAQPYVQHALDTPTTYAPWAPVMETERIFGILEHTLYQFASRTAVAPSAEQLDEVVTFVADTRAQLRNIPNAPANPRGLWKAFIGFVRGWHANPLFDSMHIREICVDWVSDIERLFHDGALWPQFSDHLALFTPLSEIPQKLRESHNTLNHFKEMLPCLSEHEINHIAAEHPAGIAHSVVHPAWGGQMLPESALLLLKQHPDVQFLNELPHIITGVDIMAALDNQLATYNPLDEDLRYTENSIIYRVKRGDGDALDEAIRHSNDDVRIAAATYSGDTCHLVLAKDKSASVRAAVAMVACEDIVHTLRNDRNTAVRVAVALRGFDEDLDVLVHDSSPKVRKAVLMSARPQDAEQLKEDRVGTIRKMAESATIVE